MGLTFFGCCSKGSANVEEQEPARDDKKVPLLAGQQPIDAVSMHTTAPGPAAAASPKPSVGPEPSTPVKHGNSKDQENDSLLGTPTGSAYASSAGTPGGRRTDDDDETDDFITNKSTSMF